MTLQQLKYFIEISNTQKFTSAAQNLYVAQSSLSYAIHELEYELGVPLFARNLKKPVTLTEYGERFLPYAQNILNLIEEGAEELKSMNDPLSGTVKMGFFYCVANSEIPHIFRRFYDDNPDCNIFLDFDVNQGSGSIDDQLLLGKYDLIIATSESIKDCECEKIGQQKLKLIVANNNPLSQKEKVTLSDIEGESLLGINPNSNLDRWIREMYNHDGLKTDITYCPDWITQFGYVAMNYGVAVSPSMPMYKDYTVELELDHPMIWRDLHLFWPKNRKLTRATEFVRDYIIKLTSKESLTN